MNQDLNGLDGVAGKVYGHSDLSKAQRYLYFKLKKKQGGIPAESRALILRGRAEFNEADMLHRADITTAGGIFDLIKSDNNRLIGVTDFQGNQIDANVNSAIDKIKIGYVQADPAGNPKINKLAYNNKKSDLPPELLNAKLHIKLDNQVLMSLPVERFTVGATSSKTQGIEDAMELSIPFILAERKTLQIQLEFGDGQQLDTQKKHFFEIRFMGAKATIKN